jgi:hypothetical protein
MSDEFPGPAQNVIRREPSKLAQPGGSVKVLGILLLLLALLAGKYAWNARSRGSTQSLVNEARQAMERKDWASAAKYIRQAKEASPDDLALLRVMVDYLDKTGLDPAFQLQALIWLKEAGLQQPADVWIAGRACLRTGDMAAARALWEKLPTEVKDTPEALEFKAGILRQEGGEGQAQHLQQLAAQKAPDNPESAFKAAALDAESVYPEQSAAGMERLWAMTTRADAAGLATIRFLVARADLTLPQVQQLRALVGKHADAGLADELRVLSLVIRLDAAERANVINDMVERHRNASLEVKVVLARWLAEERELEPLARLVPWGTMQQSNELFPIAVQALAEAGRWQQMKELLKQRALPMSEEGLAVWNALAASRLQPDLHEAQTQLQAAIKRAAAGGSYGPVRAATQVAEDLELYDVAMEGYVLLAQPKAGHELEMLEKCWETATRLGDSAQLLETARRQKALRPTSMLYAQRLDYLRLVRGVEMESVQSPAPDTVTQEVENLGISAILTALKAYRLGDRQQAARALSTVQGVAKLSAGQRAVYAGLLALLGEPARAFQLAENISPRLLTAGEQTFLEKAL